MPSQWDLHPNSQIQTLMQCCAGINHSCSQLRIIFPRRLIDLIYKANNPQFFLCWKRMQYTYSWLRDYVMSVESQKGTITIQRCSIENQKGTIALLKDVPLRTRRALSLFKDVPLRTRRALSLFKVVPLRTRRALSL